MNFFWPASYEPWQSTQLKPPFAYKLAPTLVSTSEQSAAATEELLITLDELGATDELELITLELLGATELVTDDDWASLDGAVEVWVDDD